MVNRRHVYEDRTVVMADGQQVRLITYRGVTRTLPDWARELGVSKTTLRMRLDKWYSGDVRKAFEEPFRSRKSKSGQRVVNEIKKALRVEKESPKIEPGKSIGEQIKAIKDRVESGEKPTAAERKSIRSRLDALVKSKQKVNEHALFAKHYGEWKSDACRRLKAEGRYREFRLRVGFYYPLTRKYGFSRTVAFYLALEEFRLPPIEESTDGTSRGATGGEGAV